MDISALLASEWVRVGLAVLLVFFICWLFQKLIKFLLIAMVVGFLVWRFWLS